MENIIPDSELEDLVVDIKKKREEIKKERELDIIITNTWKEITWITNEINKLKNNKLG